MHTDMSSADGSDRGGADGPVRSMLERAREFVGMRGKAKANEVAAREEAPGDQLGTETAAALLDRQLASGLWDEPGHSGEDELRSLRATMRALTQLLREGITTTHPMYGTQVRKAVEAIMARAVTLATSDPKLARLALGLAWLLASGRRTRTQIESAAGSNAAFGELRSRLGDEPRLREYVEQESQLY